MAFHDLPHTSRPRERLLQHGAAALGDVELLALLLRTGTAGRNVLVMAQDVLDACQGLAGLLHADARTLGQIKGLGGTAKRAELLAVMELARRAMAQQLQQRTLLNHPALVANYLQLHLGHLPHECFAVLFLDSQHQLIQLETLFRGTLNQTASTRAKWPCAHCTITLPVWCWRTTTPAGRCSLPVPTSRSRASCSRHCRCWTSACWTISSSHAARACPWPSRDSCPLPDILVPLCALPSPAT